MIERIYRHLRGAAARRGVRSRKFAVRSRLALETLEDRCVPSALIWELPTGPGAPFGIAHRFQRGDLPPDRNIWFTDQQFFTLEQRRIGRIDAAGNVTSFPLAADWLPEAIAAGPDGNLWFTEQFVGFPSHSDVQRITPEGALLAFPLSG